MITFKKKKVFIIMLALIILITIVGISYGERIFNNEEVIPNSDLIYYLNVYYDGVDTNGNKSSDITIANVESGYMLVEDKLPYGLIFDGFVTTSDGTIGAVRRDNNSICIGSVYDDTNETKIDDGTWNSDKTEYYYHGLHYNENNRTISFKVKNLKAGCKITVGVKTITPDNIDEFDTDNIEKRRDFYNYATVRENDITAISNIVHTYMGENALKYYNVNYSYTGNVPNNAPTPPTNFKYAKDEIASVALPINIEGYSFSGWTTSDVNVQDGIFVVPNHDVNFTGSYTPLPKYKVRYMIEGDIPKDYVIPSEKEYYESNNVVIDDTVVKNYIFSGWTTTDIDINSDDTFFVMPNHDVTFRGNFEKNKYTLTYKFYNTILPDNANELLPNIEEHEAGEQIILSKVLEPEGYKFVGWNKENEFIMPDNNLVVYGEWKYNNGVFEPEIKIEIIDPKEEYNSNEIVNFKICVTNNNDFEIKDVIIKANDDNTFFKDDDGYEVQSNHYVRIDSLPGNTSKYLYASYIVQSDDFNKVYSEVEIVGGLVDNHLVLKKNKATISFNVSSNLIIHHYLLNTTTKVYDDEITRVPFGSVYETNSKNSSELYDEYRNKYNVISNSDNISGVISNNNVEVIYYYDIDMFKISTNVIGGVGTITGSEFVIGGNDSIEDIIITPNYGYEINKVLVNGEEIDITNKDGMTLDKFINVRENKVIEVEFIEKNQITPITGLTIRIYLIVNILISIVFIMIYLYKKYTSKKENGGML